MPLLALLALTGCVETCKSVTIERDRIYQPAVITHYVYVGRSPAHSALIGEYNKTVEAEKPLVLRGTPPVINHLDALNAQLREALEPFRDERGRLTQAQVDRAMKAMLAVQVYISQREHH